MLRKFSRMSLLFLATIFVERAVELIMAWSGDIKIESYSGFLWANLVACGCQIFVVFIVFAAFFFLSKQLAKALALLLFAILAFTEMGFVIYHHSTGLMMGQEMVYRPLWETWFTVRSFLSPALISLIFVVFAAYIAFMDWYSKKLSSRMLSYVTIGLMVVSIPVVLLAKPHQDEYVANKIWYCVDDILKIKSADANNTVQNAEFMSSVKSHDEYLEIYRRMFPNCESVDNEYVIERKDNTENVLGPYFEKSDEKVNVVIIIVESLGSDLFGINDYGVCYTPFLDSLSRSSLLWTNCLSTTPRSFGAVPSITGSVPHGVRGFQFGEIPDHNSLFTILKANGYRTNAFYSGLFTFDKVYDYLVAQRVDYLSPFYEEFQADRSGNKDGDFWGYNDMTMFDKSLQVLENQNDNKPELDLFITITQHEKLALKDKKLNKYYYDETKRIMSDLPKKVRKAEKGNIGKLAATLYADDAVRRFFKSYNELHSDGNTIFVITGDHNMGLKKDSYLDAYNVPLIIWSPLLKGAKRFNSLVSHDDITPSLVALLRENFGVRTPETVHWMSDGLDTLSDVKSDYIGYLFTYSIHPVAFVDNDVFLNFKDGKAYHIGDSLKLSEADSVDFAYYKERFDALVYVDNYVYLNNKIIRNPIFSSRDFKTVKKISLPDSVFCATNAERPSVHTPDTLFFFKEKFENMPSVMKIVVEADVKFTKQVPIHHFIHIGMRCSGDKMNSTEFSDCVSKYIKNYDYQADTWEKMELSMMFPTNNSDETQLEMYLVPAEWDAWWDPEHTVTLKKIKIFLFL